MLNGKDPESHKVDVEIILSDKLQVHVLSHMRAVRYDPGLAMYK